MKTSTKKLLAASILAGSLLTGNTAFADEFDNSFSGNTIEVGAEQVEVNGVRVQQGFGANEYTLTADASEGTGNISWNSITINGGNFTLYVNGGFYSGSLIGNSITLNNGWLHITASDALSYSGTIQGNILRLNGGDYQNSYLYLPNVVATNNVVEISGQTILDNVHLFGGILGDVDEASGNVLNVNGVGLTAKNIYDFDTLNFNMPASVKNGDIVLTLTDGATDISNRVVNAAVEGGTELKTGDTIHLLVNNNGLNTTGTVMNSRLVEGVTLSYDTALTATPYGLMMTLGQPHVEEQTRALNQGAIVPANEISQSTQSLMDILPVEDFEPNSEESEGSAKLMMISNSWGFFSDANGGKLRTKTGHGSYVQSRGNGIGLGFARSSENPSGASFIISPVFDYGKSKYDSYLSNGTHGHGEAKYFLGGLFFRKMNANGFYYEASFRGGKTDIDFNSNDLFTGNGRGVAYDDSTTAFAGHVRLGKLRRLDRNNLLHIYGIYSHTHTNGMDTKISTGEHYRFDSVDSGIFQLGYRLTTAISPISKIYTGLAWQYQFNGSTSATYRGFTTPEAGIKGSTGILELGWQIRPRRTNPWALDINITGRLGLQKGIAASAGVRKAF